MPSDLLDTVDAAKFLGVPASTLRRWRWPSTCPEGFDPPPYVRLSPRIVKYSKKDLERWVKARRER